MFCLSFDISSIKISGRPEFYLAGNPFVCDCNLDWLPKINEEPQFASDSPMIMDLEDVTCRLKNNHIHTNDVALPIRSVLPEQFVCSYQTHCFSLCMCCDFYACDCRMQCPSGCTCQHDVTWGKNIITCSSRNQTNIPLLIPMDATSLRLDGNQYRHIGKKHMS